MQPLTRDSLAKSQAVTRILRSEKTLTATGRAFTPTQVPSLTRVTVEVNFVERIILSAMSLVAKMERVG